MADERSKLDELKQALYERGKTLATPSRWGQYSKKRAGTEAGDWKHEHTRPSEAPGVTVEKKPSTAMGLPIRLFIFSVIFFVIALAVAAFIITRGSNVVSSENIDITVSGPAQVGGGEVFTLQIDVTNRNNTTLELVDLIVEYPAGTRTSDGTQDPLPRSRVSLGSLTPGQRASQTVTARLFGEEGTEREIVVGIEYRVEDSNAIFFKDKVFAVEIGTSPLSLLIDIPPEVNSGKTIDITVEIVSNAEETIEDVALAIEYPFGFLFDEAEPSPNSSDNFWMIGDLAPEGRRTITLSGTMEGQDEEERTFRFIGGLAGGGIVREISTAILEAQRTLVIKRPFVQVDLVLNGSTDPIYIADPRRAVSAGIRWQNNLTVPVEDVVVTAELIGDALDEGSVQVLSGFYRSIDNTIIWDETRVSAFDRLEPGAKGTLNFDFRLQDPESALLRNDTVDIRVTIAGNRIGTTQGTTGEISSSVTKTVQVASAATIASHAVYSVGPFTNTGPLPPEVDKETTYTITWALSNTSNDLANAVVSAALPNNVRFIGTVDPSSESVTYNEFGREVRWDIGSVPAGIGYTSPPREVAFQVALVPSISQVGSAPLLVGPATLRGYDLFTETTVQSTSGEATTMITTDPTYSIGITRVVE